MPRQTGFQESLKMGADGVVLLHSDGQYPPEILPQFIKGVEEGADIVAGSRILGGNMWKQGMPLYKYIGNRFLTALANFVFQTKIYS